MTARPRCHWLGLLTICALVVTPSGRLTAQIPSAQALRGANNADVQSAATLRSVEQALNRRGTVIFRDTPISEVIYTLSQQWNINIVAGANVSGTVSGSFHDAPLKEILDSLLTVNGYGYLQNGGSLLVLRQEQVGPNNPNFRAQTLLLPANLPNEAVSEVLGALKLFSTPGAGQIHSVPSNNSVMVFDTPEKISQMQAMLPQLTGEPTLNGPATGLPPYGSPSSAMPGGGQAMPQRMPATAREPMELLKLRPQFVTTAEVAKAMELTVGAGGSFTVLDGEEILLVSGTMETLRRAQQVMEQIDVPRSQVRITAYIYDVSLNELERLGFDWSNQFMSQSLDANGLPRNSARADAGLLARHPASAVVGNAGTISSSAAATAGGTAAAAASPSGGQWVFRTLTSNFELNAVLQALDETRGAKLLADPHVTVVDRQTASIDIVTKIPIQQLTQTQQGGSIGTTAFEEAGVKLDVTPRIANDGTVEMRVVPEFSTLTGFNTAGNPIIDARRAETVVRVAHQQTLVIGGLRQKTAVETVRGIPGLMNWKFVGPLFRTHNTELRESELICFIHPEIVDFCMTGLPREEIALEYQRGQLSQIPYACPGPQVPDCRDPNCPYHHPRSRVNRGLPDVGQVQPGVMPEPWTANANTTMEPIVEPAYFRAEPKVTQMQPLPVQPVPVQPVPVQPVPVQPVPVQMAPRLRGIK